MTGETVADERVTTQRVTTLSWSDEDKGEMKVGGPESKLRYLEETSDPSVQRHQDSRNAPEGTVFRTQKILVLMNVEILAICPLKRTQRTDGSNNLTAAVSAAGDQLPPTSTHIESRTNMLRSRSGNSRPARERVQSEMQLH